MIINAVIQGSNEINKTIELTTSMNSDMLYTTGDTLSLIFSWSDTEYSDAMVGLYFDATVEGTRIITTPLDSWTITDILDASPAGVHEFRIVATNYDQESDELTFIVLSNYDEVDNMTFNLIDNKYTLTSYTNPSPGVLYTLNIEPYAYTVGDGVKVLNIIAAWTFFDDDDAQTIILPDTIERIENGAFNEATNLSLIEIHAIVPPILGENVFTGTESHLTIRVPAESLIAYQTAWGSLTTATITTL